MNDHSLAPEVTIWTDAQRAATVGQVLDRMGAAVCPIALGGPRVAEIDQLAKQINVPRQDDFRKLLVDHPAAYVLIGSWEDLSRDDLKTVLDQSGTIVALEPINAELDNRVNTAERVTIAPAFLQAPGWANAADPRDALGAIEMMEFFSAGPSTGCTLFSRLFDAWKSILQFAPLPESIDASLTGPLAEPPENLRGLAGHLLAHARINSHCSAVVTVSDRAGKHARHLHVIGEEGQIDVDDCGYQLRNSTGEQLDSGRSVDMHANIVDLIVAQWQRLIDRGGRIDTSTIVTDCNALACCLACQLSARTGEPESPQALLKMHGLV